jgi:hypothetical protein
MAARADLAGGDEGIEPGAGAGVGYLFTGCQPPQRERVAHAGEGLHRPVRQRAGRGGFITQAGGKAPAGAEVEAGTGVDGHLAVLAAYLLTQRVRVG